MPVKMFEGGTIAMYKRFITELDDWVESAKWGQSCGVECEHLIDEAHNIKAFLSKVIAGQPTTPME